MACCGRGPRRVVRVNMETGQVKSEDEAMADGETVIMEYIGPQVGGFSIPGPSGRRYRFNPPYRRTTDVRREDVSFFLQKGGYRVPTSAPAPSARIAPVREAVTIAEIQSRAARSAAAAARTSVTRPTPPQVVEQVMARAAEMVGQVAPAGTAVAEAPTRRRRVPRAVDEERTPKWTPPGF